MPKDIIIQFIPQEIRVAIRENSQLREFIIERPNFRNPVGNIYKGRVLKVMKGMSSAFVNIGLMKAGFLSVDDLTVNDLDIDLMADEDYVKSTDTSAKSPIEDLISEGQDIVLQVSKAPISTKGARVTSLISIPSRNVVFIPGSSIISLSRQITNEKDKNRIRKVVNRYKNSGFGLIVRTNGLNATEEEFRAEIDYLVKLWSDIEERSRKSKAPALLFEEPNIIIRLVRDSLESDIENIIIDDEEEYLKLKDYLSKYVPELLAKLTF